MVNFESNGRSWVLIEDVEGQHRLDLDLLQKIETTEGELTIGGNPELDYDISALKKIKVFAINVEFKNGRTKRLSFEHENERAFILTVIDGKLGIKKINPLNEVVLSGQEEKGEI
jgi:hypothetical protein